MHLLHLVGIILPIFVIVLIGYIYSRWRQPDMRAANQINMSIFLPALIFDVLSRKDFHLETFGQLALGALLVILGSGLLAFLIAKAGRLSIKTFVPPMMFSNAGNIGLPLAVFAFGEKALAAAVVLFLVENVMHFTLGIFFLNHRAPLRHIVLQPTIISTVLGLVVGYLSWKIPAPIREAINMIGQASIPLLLFALGTRLTNIDTSEWRIGVFGALMCPLTGVVMVLLVRPFLDLTPLQSSMLLVFGALPPAVLNFLFAEQFHQEPGKVASMVLFGNLAAMVTLPLALYFALS